MSEPSPIEILRENVANLLRINLQALPDFPQVPILTRQTGSLQFEVERAFSSIGLWIVVGIESVKHDGAQTARPRYQTQLSIDVHENVLLYQGVSGGRPGGWSVACLIDALLLMRNLPVSDQSCLLQSAGPMEEISTEGDEILTIRIPYTTRIAGTPRTTI